MKNKTSLIVMLAFVLNFSMLYAQNGANVLVSSGPCNPIIPILCPSGVENPANAVDNNLSSYALMRTSIGVLSSSFLRIGWNTPVAGGMVIGIFTEENTLLDVDVLSTITLTLYNSVGNQIAEKSNFSLADVQVLDDDMAVLKMKVPKNKTASSVQITIGGLLLVANDVRIYGAVWAPANLTYYADYVYDEGPCDPIVPILCPGGVLNSGNAVDNNRTNYALLAIPLGIGGNAFLDLGWTTPGPKAQVVTFLCGANSGPLDAAIIENLTLTIYDENGNVVREKDDFTLADVDLLSNNRFNIHLKGPNAGTYSTARARITMDALVAVLSEVRVYHAKYQEKVSFVDYFKSGTAASSLAAFDLNVYPNPAINTINVMLNSTSSSLADIEITNLIGQVMYTGQIEAGNSNSINIEQFNNGIYMIRVNEDGQILNKKFNVQR